MSFYNIAKKKADEKREIIQEGVEDYFDDAKDLKIGSRESLKRVEHKKSYDRSEHANKMKSAFLEKSKASSSYLAKPKHDFIDKKAKPKIAGKIGSVPIFK